MIKSAIFHTLLLLILGSATSQGQTVFTIEKLIQSTLVKNQENTGTCWSFATTSFLESEF